MEKRVDEKMRPLVEEVGKLEGVTTGTAGEDEDFTQMNFEVEDMDALMSVGNRLQCILQFLFDTAPNNIGTFTGAIEYDTHEDKDGFTKPLFHLMCEIPDDKWRYHCIKVFTEEMKKMRLKYGTKKGNIQIEPMER